jgi:hypothetical protein
VNASQRRIAKRKLARKFPVGSNVSCWYMARCPYTVLGYSPKGRVIIYHRDFSLRGTHVRPRDLRAAP